MEGLYEILPILIYMLVAALLVVLIILGLNLVKTVQKTNILLDDIEKKSQSLNGVFESVDNISNSLTKAGDRILDGLTNYVTGLFSRRKKKVKKIETEEDEDYE